MDGILSGGQQCVLCPYNPAHEVLVHRLAKHIARCKKQHPNANMVVCPYNRLHIIDKFKIEDHVKNCPNNDSVLNVLGIDGPPVSIGTVSFDDLRNQQTLIDEEDWNGDHPTYNPEVATQGRDIIRPPNEIQSKAVRKLRKKQERDRIAQIENQDMPKENPVMKTLEYTKPLRAPKNKAKALTVVQDNMDTLCSRVNHSMSLQDAPEDTLKMEKNQKDVLKKNNIGNEQENNVKENKFILKVLARIRSAQLGE